MTQATPFHLILALIVTGCGTTGIDDPSDAGFSLGDSSVEDAGPSLEDAPSPVADAAMPQRDASVADAAQTPDTSTTPSWSSVFCEGQSFLDCGRMLGRCAEESINACSDERITASIRGRVIDGEGQPYSFDNVGYTVAVRLGTMVMESNPAVQTCEPFVDVFDNTQDPFAELDGTGSFTVSGGGCVKYPIVQFSEYQFTEVTDPATGRVVLIFQEEEADLGDIVCIDGRCELASR